MGVTFDRIRRRSSTVRGSFARLSTRRVGLSALTVSLLAPLGAAGWATAASAASGNLAASPQPITCSGFTPFLIQGGQLSIGVVSGSILAWAQIGPKHSALNAMGYDPTSKYLYAMAVDSSKSSFGDLIQLDAVGRAKDLGKVQGLPTRAWKAGDVDSSGDAYYVSDGGHDLWKITLSTHKATKVPMPSSLKIGGDFIIGEGSLLTRGGNHAFDSVNLTTKVVNKLPITGKLATDPIDAVWYAGPVAVVLDSKSWETWTIGNSAPHLIGTIHSGTPVDGATCF